MAKFMVDARTLRKFAALDRKFLTDDWDTAVPGSSYHKDTANLVAKVRKIAEKFAGEGGSSGNSSNGGGNSTSPYVAYASAVEDYLLLQDARLQFWAVRVYVNLALWKGAISDPQHALLLEKAEVGASTSKKRSKANNYNSRLIVHSRS